MLAKSRLAPLPMAGRTVPVLYFRAANASTWIKEQGWCLSGGQLFGAPDRAVYSGNRGMIFYGWHCGVEESSFFMLSDNDD
ncbi:hypothetical protein ACFSQE_15675 [Vogesella fluminis]|uniref:hypothetical protein n=1 Tax=Vogesella fluminis TaxID=1069161 RepID=UPI00363D0F98